MAVRNIQRNPTRPGGYVGTTNAAPIYCDSDDNSLKFIPGGQGSTTEVTILTGVTAPVAVSAATTLAPGTHAGRTVVTGGTAGFAFTLPAATGTGAKYRIVIGTTLTSGSLTVAVASATDYMRGFAQVKDDGSSSTTIEWATANTGTLATESDTITLNRTTTGTATIGDTIELEDIATAVWSVLIRANATGTEATPFSAAV